VACTCRRLGRLPRSGSEGTAEAEATTMTTVVVGGARTMTTMPEASVARAPPAPALFELNALGLLVAAHSLAGWWWSLW